jgi:hypothetical protein
MMRPRRGRRRADPVGPGIIMMIMIFLKPVQLPSPAGRSRAAGCDGHGDFNRYCHGDRGRRRQPVGSLSHLVVLTVTRLSAPATSTFNLKFKFRVWPALSASHAASLQVTVSH